MLREGGIVILGAGECGARAAFALREQGYEGAVTLIGSERHLPYERPPLSKSTLVDEPGHRFVAPIDRYEEARIELLLGRTAENIDLGEQVIILDGDERLSFEKLLLATGSSPRRMPGIEYPNPHIKYLRTYDDAVEIRDRLGPGKSLAIIGAGFIGLELAATARKLGTSVTVIEAQPRVLMRGVPEAVAEVLAARHRAEGVDLRCTAPIASVAPREDGVTIQLDSGETIESDMVIVGIGAVPNVALAQAAGIAVDNGIAVDEMLQTSSPNVFAAGDCCSFPLPLYGNRRVRLEAWRNAQDQGTVAARNMLGAGEGLGSVPYFWSDQYDLTLQVVGLADGAATHVRRQIADDAFIIFHLDQDGVLIAASGIGQGNTIARDIKVAEMMISARKKPSAADLASTDVRLKSLLAA